MAERVSSCTADPNFAVICSFLQRFSVPCGIEHPNFLELQEMLENSQEVPQSLVDLHVKLLRKARKSVSVERWERAVVKFCHTYSGAEYQQDGWEVERLGYKNLRIDTKLRILKLLLEHQFDLNSKFKAEVNRLSSEELRLQPLGRDKVGQNYWLQQDEFCNIHVYREDADNDTWQEVASNRETLVDLIGKLSEGNLDAVFNSEDSNSQEGSENIDTGQESKNSNDSQSEKCNKRANQRDDHASVTNRNIKSVEHEIKVEKKDGIAKEESTDVLEGKECTNEIESTGGVKMEKEDDNPLKEEHLGSTNNADKNGVLEETEEQVEKETDNLQCSKDSAASLKRSSAGEQPADVKRSKLEQSSENDVSEAVEEKVMVVSGEGSGKDCETRNPMLDFCDVGEAIEEPVMFVYGDGSGRECDTGNPENADEADQSSKGTDGTAKMTAKKVESESTLNSTNGNVDEIIPKESNGAPTSESEDASSLDLLGAGFFFGPGTLAAKDKIPVSDTASQQKERAETSVSDLGDEKECLSSCEDKTAPEPTESSTVDTVTESTEASPVDTVTETTKPSTADTVKETTEPSTADTVKETTEPSTADTVKETTEPSSAGTVTETAEPSTVDTVTETTEPSTADTVKETTEPSSAGTVTETAEPSTAGTVKQTSEASPVDTVTETTQPSTADTDIESTEPSSAGTVIETAEPSTVGSVTGTTKSSFGEMVKENEGTNCESIEDIPTKSDESTRNGTVQGTTPEIIEGNSSALLLQPDLESSEQAASKPSEGATPNASSNTLESSLTETGAGATPTLLEGTNTVSVKDNVQQTVTDCAADIAVNPSPVERTTTEIVAPDTLETVEGAIAETVTDVVAQSVEAPLPHSEAFAPGTVEETSPGKVPSDPSTILKTETSTLLGLTACETDSELMRREESESDKGISKKCDASALSETVSESLSEEIKSEDKSDILSDVCEGVPSSSESTEKSLGSDIKNFTPAKDSDVTDEKNSCVPNKLVEESNTSKEDNTDSVHIGQVKESLENLEKDSLVSSPCKELEQKLQSTEENGTVPIPVSAKNAESTESCDLSSSKSSDLPSKDVSIVTDMLLESEPATKMSYAKASDLQTVPDEVADLNVIEDESSEAVSKGNTVPTLTENESKVTEETSPSVEREGADIPVGETLPAKETPLTPDTKVSSTETPITPELTAEPSSPATTETPRALLDKETSNATVESPVVTAETSVEALSVPPSSSLSTATAEESVQLLPTVTETGRVTTTDSSSIGLIDEEDDGPPAITTLEEAMRAMEAAGAPVRLDLSDEDETNYQEAAAEAPPVRQEEEEEEEKSFLVFEGSTRGWKHETTGRKEEVDHPPATCDEEMFSELTPLMPAAIPGYQQSTLPQDSEEVDAPGAAKKLKKEGKVPAGRVTRSTRTRGGPDPVAGVDVSECADEEEVDQMEKDPLALSEEEKRSTGRGRKRRSSDPLASPDSTQLEVDGKRARMRGKRPVDRDLRQSVEERRAEQAADSSDEGCDAAGDLDPDQDQDPLPSEEETKSPAPAPRRGGWRGGRRGRGRRGRGRGRGAAAASAASKPDASSAATAAGEAGDAAQEPMDVVENATASPTEKKPKGQRKNRMLAELEVNMSMGGDKDDAEGGSRVRASRRLAQIRLKEQAERREIEEAELTAREQYKSEKEARKAAKLEKRRHCKGEGDSEGDSESGENKKKKKKHKKKKHPVDKFNKSTNIWAESDSDSSSSASDEEEDIPEPSDDEAEFAPKSDHEFSCESDVNDEEYQPTRRARTARRDKEAEVAAEEPQDYPCKKCAKSDQPEWMLLCDSCDAGWHCSCLRPALLLIPEGDWYCPPCQHNQLVSRMQEHLRSYDADVKKLASEEARRARMTFVDISVENVLPEDEGERIRKKKRREKEKLRRQQEEEEEEDDDPDAEEDSNSSSSDSSSGSGTESSSSSSSPSPSPSSDEDEPIYQLRQRRQTSVNSRMNEYDDLMKSAIQDGIEEVAVVAEPDLPEAVEGADLAPVKPVQSVGKVLEGEEDEQKEEEEDDEEEEKKPVRRGKYLTDEEEEEEPEKKAADDDDEDEEEEEEEEEGFMPPVLKNAKGKRKKHRPLTALEVSSSESDPESDEDFKGSSSEEEEEDESSVSGSDDSVVLSRRKGSGPTRRSNRNRITRYDREFIDDEDYDDSDDSDAPRRKKTRRQSSDSRRVTKGKMKKKTKKKIKKNDDSDKEVRIKPKPKSKSKVKFGGLKSGSDSDTPQPRRTRGRRMDYREVLASSDEDQVIESSKKNDSEDEFVADEDGSGKESEEKPKDSGKSSKKTPPRVKVTPVRGVPSSVSITPSNAPRPTVPNTPAVTITPSTKKPSTSNTPPTQLKTPSRVVAPGIPPSISAVAINPKTKSPVGEKKTGISTLKALAEMDSYPDMSHVSQVGPAGVGAQPGVVTQAVTQVVMGSQAGPVVQPGPGAQVTQMMDMQTPTTTGDGKGPGLNKAPTTGPSPQTTYAPSSSSGPLMAMQALAGEPSYSYQHYYHQPPPPTHTGYLPGPGTHHVPHHPSQHHPSPLHSSPHHPTPHHPAPHHPSPHHPSPHHPSPHHPSPHHPTPHHPTPHHPSPHHPTPHHPSPHHPTPHHPTPHHPTPHMGNPLIPAQHHHMPPHHAGAPPHHPAFGPPVHHALAPPNVAQPEDGRPSEFGGLVSYFSSQHDDLNG